MGTRTKTKALLLTTEKLRVTLYISFYRSRRCRQLVRLLPRLVVKQGRKYALKSKYALSSQVRLKTSAYGTLKPNLYTVQRLNFAELKFRGQLSTKFSLNKFRGFICPTGSPLQTATPTVCFMVYACAYAVLPRPRTDLTAVHSCKSKSEPRWLQPYTKWRLLIRGYHVYSTVWDAQIGEELV